MAKARATRQEGGRTNRVGNGERLKLYRHVVFHFHEDYYTKLAVDFVKQPDIVPWVRELSSELGRWFLDWTGSPVEVNRTPPPGTLIGFKFGDVFPVDDAVGEWLATLAMAFNDIAFVHRQLDDAYTNRPAYEYFYFLRLAIGHFNEGAALLDKTEMVTEISGYVASLDSTARVLYGDCLKRYRSQRSVVAQARNYSAFHYPKFQPSNQRRVMRRALLHLANEHGWTYKAPSRTIRDSRLLWADDIESVLFEGATANHEDLFAAHEEIKASITSFMRFVNAALDEWWQRALKRGVSLPTRRGDPPSYGTLAETAADRNN